MGCRFADVFKKAGYKTGLYTSPHLKDFRERIRINGKMVAKSFVKDFVNQQKHNIKEIEPSFFEVTVAMAFDYFAKEKVDVAVIEVGLGGRLDSTNIITPELSVITNISLDHTNLLGDTLPEIAFEKAGIIKSNVPVVIGEKHPETINVFKDKAKAEKAPIYFAEDSLSVSNSKLKGFLLSLDVIKNDEILFKNLVLDLSGVYQQKNILTVIQSVITLREIGFSISDDVIYQALKNVKKLTGLQGRWQVLYKNPLVICDTGHNEAGITEVLKNIENTAYQNLHFVIGMVRDKDINGVLALLPQNATYYFCKPNLERALPAQELAEKAAAHNLNGNIFESVQQAFQRAKQNAGTNDLVFVGGSTFVVAEIL